MCDYSLECYRSRRAEEGEELVTRRFPSLSQGFVSPEDRYTAVCLKPDTKLALRGIPVSLQRELGVGAEAVATFDYMYNSRSYYHDALFFGNGKAILINALPEGLQAEVLPNESQLDEVNHLIEDAAAIPKPTYQHAGHPSS